MPTQDAGDLPWDKKPQTSRRVVPQPHLVGVDRKDTDIGNQRGTLTLIAIVALSREPPHRCLWHSAPTAAAKTRPAPKGAIVTFAVGLKRNDAAASALVAEVSDPRSKQYRAFPVRSTVRAEYGAKPASLKALRRSAERFTLNVSLDRTGVFAQQDMSRWLAEPSGPTDERRPPPPLPWSRETPKAQRQGP
jgi:hypothetical protein